MESRKKSRGSRCISFDKTNTNQARGKIDKNAKQEQKIKCFFKKDLTSPNQCAIIPKCLSKAYLGVAQLVARYLGVVEAASSSLVTQTKKTSSLKLLVFLYFTRDFRTFLVRIFLLSSFPVQPFFSLFLRFYAYLCAYLQKAHFKNE